MELKNNIHIYSTPEEWDMIKNAIDDERSTPTGRIRHGDAVRKIFLEWIELKKTVKK